MESAVSVFVQELEVDVAIGIEDHEKQGPQKLWVSVELFAAPDYLKIASEDTLIDYAKIVEAVKQWESRGHVDLIESYLNELLDVCFADTRVQSCRVAIAKPDIFKDAKSAGVEVFMRREDWQS